MGFGFYEKLGQKKGRVEVDAIRDQQIHIY